MHLGITGEDLIRETLPMSTARSNSLAPLGFGRADVVVAVPDCWIDVACMADLEDVAAQFARAHGRRLRVATKYMNLTRRFFAEHGVAGYRIVESAGATEGTPAPGTAELIVDITTTGTTLSANHLKVLDDGVILKSQSHLFAARAAQWTPKLRRSAHGSPQSWLSRQTNDSSMPGRSTGHPRIWACGREKFVDGRDKPGHDEMLEAGRAATSFCISGICRS